MWVCFGSSLPFLAVSIIQWRRVHAKLTIHWALWYGRDREISKNQTVAVRGWVNGNSIHHYVHEDELGEEPKGDTKRLEVCYSLGSMQNRVKIVVNGKDLVIPEPALAEVP